jgi:hypothetical protein
VIGSKARGAARLASSPLHCDARLDRLGCCSARGRMKENEGQYGYVQKMQHAI